MLKRNPLIPLPKYKFALCQNATRIKFNLIHRSFDSEMKNVAPRSSCGSTHTLPL